MRVTARWVAKSGRRGRVPGRFATVYDAEQAARDFMAKYPAVTLIAISHETGGWVKDVKQD